jgi:hypothetical protein
MPSHNSFRQQHLKSRTIGRITKNTQHCQNSFSYSPSPGHENTGNLVWQVYHGYSVKSGKKSGVQSRIKEVARQAFYVHCNAHILNVFLVDTVKVAPQADCFFAFLQRLNVFMSATYVNTKWLNTRK